MEDVASWLVELDVAADVDSWFANSLRFGTRDEADTYGVNLQARWSAIRRYRVVESSDRPNARYMGGVIYRL